MRKFFLSCVVLSMFATPAFAELKAGKFAGQRKCAGKAGDQAVVVTSKKTIGVATCKGELQKALTEKGVCAGKKKGEKVEYSFQFGADDDKEKATGTHYVLCKG